MNLLFLYPNSYNIDDKDNRDMITISLLHKHNTDFG